MKVLRWPTTNLVLLVIGLAGTAGCWSHAGPVNPAEEMENQYVPDFPIPAQGNGLEFRILANDFDDKEAIEETVRLLDNAHVDLAANAELTELQIQGLPPPGPNGAKADAAPKVFPVSLAKNQVSTVSYSWVELGPKQRRTLGLDNAAQNEPWRNAAWLQMEEARRHGKALPLNDIVNQAKLLQGALFYSRECKDRNRAEDERRKKQFDYFVLAREPEWIDGKQTPKIDGSLLLSALVQADSAGRPAVSFTLSPAGGRLFGALTRKNSPTVAGGVEIKRHLAIIVNGVMESAPNLNSEITTHGQISGNFTQREVHDLVNLLRVGAPNQK
jgi:preprotein translocase subunit SecD